MSTKSTIYDVSVLYKMDDKASSALADMANNATKAENKVMGLKEAFLGIGAALGGKALFDHGKEAFVTFNSQVEQAKLGIASVRKMFNTEMTFDHAMAESDKLFEHYQQVAKKSTGTTMDFVNMHKDLSGSFEKAGASIKDMKDITAGVVTSAPALGFDSGMASLDIKQMFAGTIGARDRFASMLIQMGGESVEKFNAKAKTDPKFVLDFLGKTFNSDGLKQARDKMEHTFEGAMSTLKDNIEINLGKAGKPLFEAISNALNSMNDWVDKHPKEIEAWVNTITKTLMDGFGMMKSAVHWVVDHKTELMAVAGAFVTLKSMSMIGGSLVGGVNGFADAIMGMKTAALGTTAGLGSFVGGLTTAVGALGALYLAAQAFADWATEKALDRDKNQAEANLMAGLFNKTAKGLGTAHGMENAEGDDTAYFMREQGTKDANALLAPIVDHIKEAGAFTKDAKVDWDKFSAYTQRLNLDPAMAAELGPMVDEAFKRFAVDGSIWSRLGLGKPNEFDTDETKRKKAGKTAVNVTIHKVEVASADPDRFAFGLDKAFKKVAQNPTSAADTLRGGF